MSTFGVMQHLDVVVCQDATDAINKGYLYRDGFNPIEIEKAVVVRNGTEGGNATVDLILVDKEGKKFVVMVTAALLKTLVQMT